MSRSRCRSLGVWLVAVVAGASASLAGPGLPGREASVESAYPGVRVAHEKGQVRAVYGKPMTVAHDPQIAAARWLAQFGGVYGVGTLTLEQAFVTPVRDGRFTALGYTQVLEGVDVEHGVGRVLVLDRGDGTHAVVYAAGAFAAAPEGGFPPILLAADAALEVASGIAHEPTAPLVPVAGVAGGPDAALIEWAEPVLAIWAGEQAGIEPSVRAWKVTGTTVGVPGAGVPWTRTYFIDASTGQVVHERSELHFIDVTGTATGMGSPGTLPDIAQNPEVVLPLESLRVSITGGNTAVTEDDGSFVIAHGGTTAVTVTANINDALFVAVNNTVGSELSVSQVVTPPGPADLLFNAAPTEFATAQVNGFYHTLLTHDLIRDRAPGFGALDIALACNVNDASLPCNAFFSSFPLSINFMRLGSGCNNTAYSTVVNHEYGHFIVNRLGLAQGAFGEGYGDTMSMLINDTCVVGEFFFTGGGFIRNPCTANKQYPCGGQIHDCGQVLAGAWYDVRLNLGNTLGSGPGLDLARDLCAAWSLITVGGSGSNSAHPTTAIEVLVVDDNDGNIDNGTPNRSDICAAFSKHGIACPELALITFSFPDGLPETLTPGKATAFAVHVEGVGAEPEPGSGLMFFSVDGGAHETQVLAEPVPNQYIATLPALSCGQTISYFFTAKTVGGDVVSSPATGEFAAIPATNLVTAFHEDFEPVVTGWVVTGNATTGKWEFGVPTGGGARGDPPTDADGSGACALTQNGAGDTDIDNGNTVLTSPAMDATGGEAFLSYWRWYSNDFGNAPFLDTMIIEISNDNGATWKQLETVGPVQDASGGWVFKEFRVADFVTPTSAVKVRFDASDLGAGSVVEAAIDGVLMKVLECEDAACIADCNADGSLNIFDFLCFQGKVNTGDPAADCNGDGSVNIFDFLCFQGEFNAGCG